MCTLTIIPLAEGSVRVACNRDELHTRPAALPPVIRTFRGRAAIMPIDKPSDGTWIAVNDAGIILSLLNVNLQRSTGAAAERSRGELIPAVAHHSSIGNALAALSDIDPALYRPVRIVVTDGETVGVVRSDGSRIKVIDERGVDRPLIFSSSGLGDHLVEEPRAELFREVFENADASDWPALQDSFHRHRWHDRPHLSVNMAREDARTISHTIIECSGARARMMYRDSFDFGEPVSVELNTSPREALMSSPRRRRDAEKSD